LEGDENLLQSVVKAAVASAKGAAVVTGIDLGVAFVVSGPLSIGYVPALGLVTLLESAILMLLGGALSFSGQPGVRKLTAFLTRTRMEVSRADLEDLDAMAAVFALVGVMLFLESLAISAASL